MPTSAEIVVVSEASTFKKKAEATDEINHLPESTLNHDPEE
ncbi:MAG TPA: hypothetical protein VI338_03715 [Nitrososphaera sp.]|nr:hypothetical protein [Nitrososphaera sp.]